MKAQGWEEVCEKVRLQYGPEAEKIVRDRPGITEQDITNFDIFDKKIIDLLGFGGVNSFITYNMSSSKIISELVNNSELLNAYKEFAKITGDFYSNTAIGLDDRLNAFYINRELFQDIIHRGRIDELKDNLLLMLRDQEFKGLNQLIYRNNKIIPIVDGIKEGLKVRSIEELVNYRRNRNNVLNNAIGNSSLNWGQIRQLIIMKYFGNIYNNMNSTGQYDDYDHKKFLKDYLKFNSCELSEDEIDLIEVYSIIQETEDEAELRKLNDFLDNRDDDVNPVRMKYIDRKVVENYKREYVDSLLKVEDVEKMVADSNNKSYLETIYKKNGDILTTEYWKKKDGTIVYRDHIEMTTGEVLYEYKVDDENYGIIKKWKIGKEKYH